MAEICLICGYTLPSTIAIIWHLRSCNLAHKTNFNHAQNYKAVVFYRIKELALLNEKLMQKICILEEELPIKDATLEFTGKHIIIGDTRKDNDFKVIRNILKCLNRRKNKITTNNENIKLLDIVRKKRNNKHWGVGLKEGKSLSNSFLLRNDIDFIIEHGSIDQTCDEIVNAKTGQMKKFCKGQWFISKKEFNVYEILLERLNGKDVVSLTKFKKPIILGLIKNAANDGFIINHFERAAENCEVKEVNNNYRKRQRLRGKMISTSSFYLKISWINSKTIVQVLVLISVLLVVLVVVVVRNICTVARGETSLGSASVLARTAG